MSINFNALDFRNKVLVCFLNPTSLTVLMAGCITAVGCFCRPVPPHSNLDMAIQVNNTEYTVLYDLVCALSITAILLPSFEVSSTPSTVSSHLPGVYFIHFVYFTFPNNIIFVLFIE